MALNVSMIYQRTDRGVREVYEKSHQFTQSERLILILLDGRLNVAGLKTRLPSLNDERIERALRKLQDAGLVEPMGAGDPSRANGSGVREGRLEPEAVAQFLEQSDLDPITIFGDTEEAVASELVRARVEQAAAQLAREATQQPSRATAARRQAQSAPVESIVSVRSHQPSVAERTTRSPEWEAATHFAITTVNVPDRLDLQEERDRAETDELTDERRRQMLRTWMKRLLVVAAIGVVVTGIYSTLQPIQREVSAPKVAEGLTQVFRRPVTVSDTEFRFTPSPRMVIRGIQAGDIKVEEVSLLINWKDLWSALRGGQWVWGEATVAPLSLTASQAEIIARALPAGANSLSSKLSTIRFDSVRISDTELLPGRYEAVLRRGADGRFGPLLIRQLDTDGAMRLALRPAQTSDGRPVLDFRLDADRWALPFGPKVKWNEVRANGRLDGRLIEISSYSLAGFYGVASGMLYAASDVEWVITGRTAATNLDIESIVQHVRKAPANQDAAVSPMQGTASLDLTVVGRGSTLEEAVQQSVFAGPLQVRWAALNGINLGLAATQGATSAGITRFTEFDGTLGASSAGVRFEDTGGRAGALTARGDFTVAPDQAVAGTIRVELGGSRIQTMTLRVRGNVLEPRFGP
ncbi:MAG TPA: hypothetical protein VMK32_05605 [Burkholderiaceae bacterium]|nr:hypothetical protein [Burkholderiaceae bacterium]